MVRGSLYPRTRVLEAQDKIHNRYNIKNEELKGYANARMQTEKNREPGYRIEGNLAAWLPL